jgi:hypothetical protein
MAEPTRPSKSDDTDVGPDRPSTRGRPRWVIVAVIVLMALVLLLVVLSRIGEHSGGGGEGGDRSADEAAAEAAGEPSEGSVLRLGASDEDQSRGA